MNLDLELYEKARTSAVIFDRTDCAKIQVSGADHAVFLHNILSQDILAMRPGEWRETALLSATSHVLAYMFAVKLADSVLLLSVPETNSKICGLLEKFLITEDVQIRDAGKDWNLFEIWGPAAEKMIRVNAPQAMTYKPEGNRGPRAVALTPSTSVTFKSENCGDEALRETLRIENGILEFGKDFNETIMLSETRLEKKSASETKGCYPGQEVVAKIETYKRLNRSFVGLMFNLSSAVDNSASEPSAQPAAGSAIIDPKSGEEIGRLTSRAYSPFHKKTVGLGWLKRGFFEQPIEVSIKAETAIPAQTTLFKN